MINKGLIMSENQEVISSITGSTLNYSDVEKVARCWIIDFTFRSLCHYYQEQNSHKFSSTLRAFEAMVDDEIQLQEDHQAKRTICCFLSRIMDGKNLDTLYEVDNRVTPLMSALSVWGYLKEATSDAALHENIRNLLFIQCVGVCLEKGNAQLAAHTLQWLEKEGSVPEKLQRKLSTIVSKKDVYDQLLTSFSYTRLLESVNSFLDAFLEEHPSDFLFRSASKVVQARQLRAEHADSDQKCEEPEPPPSPPHSPEKNESKIVSSELNIRPKKKLLNTKTVQPWKPETVKKTQFVPRGASSLKVSRRSFKVPPVEESRPNTKHRSKKMWTWQEDKLLKAGVRKHGEGRWRKILEEFDFGGRNSVMLKDRWRTLKNKGVL
ncbi:telomeric repeat-binding factor 1 [Trichomycterus rosablanca]|uniref:telomeric repeat-binding factor 1 n=1 Tax=Trichomycterus rosablanca TaxID=2290929 RepID=UPI002F35E910